MAFSLPDLPTPGAPSFSPALLSPWTYRVFYSPRLLFLKVSSFPSFSDNPDPHLYCSNLSCCSQPFSFISSLLLITFPASGPNVFLPSSLHHTHSPCYLWRQVTDFCHSQCVLCKWGPLESCPCEHIEYKARRYGKSLSRCSLTKGKSITEPNPQVSSLPSFLVPPYSTSSPLKHQNEF